MEVAYYRKLNIKKDLNKKDIINKITINAILSTEN